MREKKLKPAKVGGERYGGGFVPMRGAIGRQDLLSAGGNGTNDLG